MLSYLRTYSLANGSRFGIAEVSQFYSEGSLMQKKPRFTFVKMLVLFVACYPLAIVLEGVTGWHTPGAFVLNAVATHSGEVGLSNARYWPILVVTDAIFCFVVILLAFTGLRRLTSNPERSS